MGIYKRKQESKKTRKQELDQKKRSRKQEKTKENKNSTKKALKKTRKQKENTLFTKKALSWSSSCFLSFFLVFLFSYFNGFFINSHLWEEKIDYLHNQKYVRMLKGIIAMLLKKKCMIRTWFFCFCNSIIIDVLLDLIQYVSVIGMNVKSMIYQN